MPGSHTVFRMRQATQAGSKPKGKSLGKKSTKESSTALVIADDSSVASADSVPASDNGSQPVGSMVGSVVSAAESEMSILQKKYGGGSIEKFKLETCTVLVFISLDGILSEYPQTKRIMSYSELQRDIARVQPKTKKMYVIQDVNGLPLSAKNFKGYDIIRVKEICVKPRFDHLRKLPLDWEETGYHEAVQNKPDDMGDSVSYLSQDTDDDSYRGF